MFYLEEVEVLLLNVQLLSLVGGSEGKIGCLIIVSYVCDAPSNISVFIQTTSE